MTSSSNELLLLYWRGIMLILTPVILLPLPILVPTTESYCAFIIIVIVIYWVFDVIHFAVVSLIPIFAFPLFGILDSDAVSASYMDDANIVFLASLIAGSALEISGIHKRIALLILIKLGTSPRMLLFGVMLTTMCLSTWIMDVTSCAVMVPIVDSIVKHIEEEEHNSQINENRIESLNDCVININSFERQLSSSDSSSLRLDLTDSEIGIIQKSPPCSIREEPGTASRFEKSLLLSVAYASAIGGIGTLTGTTTNIVFKEFLVKLYDESPGISYATWMAFGIPTMIFCTLILCTFLQLIALGCRIKPRSQEREQQVRETLLKSYAELGHPSYRECATFGCLIILVLLWFFRRPDFIDGWQLLFTSSTRITDSAPAILMIVIMCSLPGCLSLVKGKGEKDDYLHRPKSHLIDWEVVQNRIPWDILLLQGGGFAMAKAAQASGLTKWLGLQFVVFKNLPSALICYILALITSCLSEVISNSSVAAMLLPVVNDMAVDLKYNPLYFTLPVTFASTLAFSLPIASGPNAIIYKTRKLGVKYMLRNGIIANILSVSSMYFMLNTLGVAIFDLNSYPEWGYVNNNSTNKIIDTV